MFNTKKSNFSKILISNFSIRNETLSLDPLAQLIDRVNTEDFEVVLAFLKDSETITENLKYYIHRIFNEKPFNLSLTEANILSENAFLPELRKRALNKFLPPVENEDTVWHIVDNISFNPKKNLRYFRNAAESDIDELMQLLDLQYLIKKTGVKKELIFSINILAWRLVGNALDAEIMNMAPEYKNFENPFLALENELDHLVKDYKVDFRLELHTKDDRYKQIKVYIGQCLDFVKTAFKNASIYGISSKTNQNLLKIRQQLQRISDILLLLVIDRDEDYLNNSKQLIFNILEYKSHKNNIRDLVNDSTTLMSHLITNHTAEKGGQYISSNTKDYFEMFWKASFGGIIVGFLCVFKMYFSTYSGSDFAHAILYSLNYSIGFILIYLFNFTLATKQPAMTAATMAKVLSDDQNTKKNYVEFAHLVSKLFRTQFIAFTGNVLFSFPVAIIIINILQLLLHKNLATNAAPHLLQDLDPFHSKAILHACIAGFFLFISGIIAGNVGNNSVYYQIPKRIEKNALLRRFFNPKITKKLANFYEKHWSGLVSNFWFGVFLGVTGPIGHFLGLDINIRHITFAAGSFALGLFGQDFMASNYTFWVSLITVFIIGFFNFFVSFGLSMNLAFRSRKVNFGEIKEIYRHIFWYFLRNPFKFFLPIPSFLDKSSKLLLEQSMTTKSKDR